MKMLHKPWASVMLLAGMVALAFMFTEPATAADLPLSFKATTLNGTQVTITPHRLASFECVGGQVNTVRADSDQKYYTDASGALCTMLKAMPNFAVNWIKQPGAERWFQVNWASMQCYAGATLVTYSATLQVPGDGCQLDTLVKEKSN